MRQNVCVVHRRSFQCHKITFQIAKVIFALSLLVTMVSSNAFRPLEQQQQQQLEPSVQQVEGRSVSDLEPLLLFFSTQYFTLTELITTATTMTTYNTCYKTAEGISECQGGKMDAKRSLEVDARPRILLQGKQIDWETFIEPTRVWRKYHQNNSKIPHTHVQNRRGSHIFENTLQIGKKSEKVRLIVKIRKKSPKIAVFPRLKG